MLNIGRMAPGSHDYYLSVVASGAEDYYVARGEAPGRRLGCGAEQLGLEGRVEADQLRQVLAGSDPHTGTRLAAHAARKVPGFDLTFRAPKSVSLLWALRDGAIATEVREAHDASVESAISFVEREAARTRRGAGGTERVEVDGLIAAAFRHRNSRSGDPLLHTPRPGRQPRPQYRRRGVTHAGVAPTVPLRQDRGLPLPGPPAPRTHTASWGGLGACRKRVCGSHRNLTATDRCVLTASPGHPATSGRARRDLRQSRPGGHPGDPRG